MNKILQALQSKVAQIIAWICLFLSAGILVYNSVSVENISNGLVLFMAIISAISAVVVFVKKMLK